MKRAFTASFTGILLALILTNAAYAQDLASNRKSSSAKIVNPSPAGTMGAIPSGQVNSKAIKKFSKEFKNVADAKWFIHGKKEYIVYFMLDDVKHRVYYTKNGHYEGMIRDYGEDKLPEHVRRLIKSGYYDFDIYHVNEITFEGTVIYVVKLEGKSTWRTVVITDDEMRETENYLKA